MTKSPNVSGFHKCLYRFFYGAIWATMLATGFGLLAGIFILWSQDYEAFSQQLLSWAGKDDWKDYFQSELFPAYRFQLTRYLSLFLLLGYLLFIRLTFVRWRFWAVLNSNKYSCFLKSFTANIRSTAPNLKYFYWIGVLLFALLSCYNIYSYALEYDEAWTYNHFVSKGFIFSAISPNNNHILYTLLASISNTIPWIDPKYLLRLPAFLVGLTSVFFFWSFVVKRFSPIIALLSFFVFTFSSSLIFFSFLARGYGLNILMTIIVLWAALNILSTKDAEKEKDYWGLCLIGTVLGVYANPAFLLAYASILMLLVAGGILGKKTQKYWLKLFRSNYFLLLILIFIHLPLLATNGMNILWEATEKTIQVNKDFWLYPNRLADWWFWGKGAPLIAIVLFLLVALASLFIFNKDSNKKNKYLVLAAIIAIGFPFLLYFVLGMELHYRMFAYAWVFIALAIGLLAEVFYNRIAKWLFIPIMIGLFAVQLYVGRTHYFINWSKAIDHEAQEMAELLLSQQPQIRECYSFSRYDLPLLEYYFLTKGRKLKVWTPFEESKNWKPFQQRVYDSVLLDIEDYKPTESDLLTIESMGYRLLYENWRVRLYVR